MFRKVIVFELLEMIKKKKIVRTASPGPSLAFGSGRVRWRGLSHLSIRLISLNWLVCNHDSLGCYTDIILQH